MNNKTAINDFEYSLVFQKAELMCEREKLTKQMQELYKKESDFAYAQREYKLNNYQNK